MIVTLAHINTTDPRLVLQQNKCLDSLLRDGHIPFIRPGHPRQFLTDMLREARQSADGYFAWINSDCVPTKDLDYYRSHNKVVGIHREESDGGFCEGVDCYIFPVHLWDELYEDDAPRMYVGASHVDWWLSRLAQKHNVYRAIQGGIWHISHERTASSKGVDKYGQHNIEEFNQWADRNGVYRGFE